MNFSTGISNFVCMTDTPNITSDFTSGRGEIVKSIVDKYDVTYTKLATQIGVSRPTLYRYFENDELDYEVIVKIGAAIGHDFIKNFPEMSMYMTSYVRESIADYQSKNKHDDLLNQALKEIDMWKSKAYANLEEAQKWKDKYYELIERKL